MGMIIMYLSRSLLQELTCCGPRSEMCVCVLSFNIQMFRIHWYIRIIYLMHYALTHQACALLCLTQVG